MMKNNFLPGWNRWLLIVAILVPAAPLCGQRDLEATADARFARWDKNGDGSLTPAELNRPRLFAWLDRNEDGRVSRDEARHPRPRESSPARPREIAYGQHRLQKLDLYLPANERDTQSEDAAATAPRPVMVYVHGGGWQKGDKRGVGQKPSFFSRMGWILVSVNYRLLPDGRHPRNVQDLAAAIDWVHGNIGEYGGDPKQIFLMGHSAGAHLVALVATDDRHLQKHGHSLAVLRGVISLDTNAYDVTQQVQSRSLYRDVFGTEREGQLDASPEHHVRKGKSIPPFLIAYSSGLTGARNPRRREAAETFAKRLDGAGVDVRVIDASDRNHGQINQWFGRVDDKQVTVAAREFLNRLAKSAPSSPPSAGGARR